MPIIGDSTQSLFAVAPNSGSACWSVSSVPLYCRAVQPRGGAQVSEVYEAPILAPLTIAPRLGSGLGTMMVGSAELGTLRGTMFLPWRHWLAMSAGAASQGTEL